MTKSSPFCCSFRPSVIVEPTLFVTQQRVEAVMVLGNEAGAAVLTRCEGSAVDESPQFSRHRKSANTPSWATSDRGGSCLCRGFHRGQTCSYLTLPYSFGFVGLFAALDTVADLFETRTRAVDEDYRLTTCSA
jgi:hypothetical protein